MFFNQKRSERESGRKRTETPREKRPRSERQDINEINTTKTNNTKEKRTTTNRKMNLFHNYSNYFKLKATTPTAAAKKNFAALKTKSIIQM
jgi:hypothetical protein